MPQGPPRKMITVTFKMYPEEIEKVKMIAKTMFKARAWSQYVRRALDKAMIEDLTRIAELMKEEE